MNDTDARRRNHWVSHIARWGETPVAVAVLAPGASLTLDELRERGTARLARYKLPTVLHVVDALPRNASGKVMKTALRREYLLS
jgi:fatty-acyl-CoA synthase